ncbi:MAG TPA: altronate dehydratase family protein [Bryobacteraceae bacterium]|nr:altronate dehydratase family protein [Bryobacteraceae bacterium]
MARRTVELKISMLYEIAGAATAANSAILLNPEDNVCIARVALSAGQNIEVGPARVLVQDNIPAAHKVAFRTIARGESIVRYGNVIGFATRDIAAGEHVHVHNLGYRDVDYSALQLGTAVLGKNVAAQPRTFPRTFQGFRRPDGRVGTRNYIGVVAASNCAAHTAELIARSFDSECLPPNVDGVVAFPHGEGCAMSIGPDTDQLQRTLQGVLDHPNIFAAVVLGLGCEVNQISHYLGRNPEHEYTPPANLRGLTLQESGGTTATVAAARHQIQTFIDQAAKLSREEISASHLSLGLNCGGSDSFSGITANPALGYCCDLIVEQGGTVVLAETTEIIGAEHLLLCRARSREVAEKLLARIEDYRIYLSRFGGSFNDNPSPGNKEGGLTNILEKSLGAVAKAGTTPLEDVCRYAERVTTPGFVFMDTPGYDPVSITGLAAGGVNVIAFTTGRGSAIGFPSVPVLKIASNSHTYRRMTGNMDINAGKIADGTASIEDVGREIFESVLRVASGERTLAERLGHHEFAPWRIGPVL